MNDIEVTVYDVNYLPDYVEAEEERQANEAIRISNENTRISNESTRVSSENTRVSQESGRVTAEGLRVQAESGRVDAESLRVSAEEGRVEAENGRVAAEEAREATINSLATVATTGKSSDLINDAGFIDKDVNDLTYYTLATDTGSTIDLSINSSTYVVTLALKNAAGTTISSDTIDLPLESVVVGGSYDSTNKKVVLTLQSGSTIEFSVADLVAGLQTEITSSNKLSSDLVDDTNHTNKFVTASDKTNWNAKYDKPSGGIPKTDLASAVQTSLGKADTAVQNTDYASSSTGGVIKVRTDFGTNMTSGFLSAEVKTNTEYTSADNKLIIGKGTLENVLTARIGDLETILETLDTGSGVNGN